MIILIWLYYWGITQTLDIYLSNGTVENFSFSEIDSIKVTPPLIGSMRDIDGNTYRTIKIGDQWWMAENLKVTHYRNGDNIPNIRDDFEWIGLTTGALCSNANRDGNAIIYGYLYNWYAIIDNRSLAPEGWHIPTDEEWKELEINLGMSRANADGTDWRGDKEGGMLKETGTVHWSSPNTGATNQFGFTALPGGLRHEIDMDTFFSVGFTAFFWTSSESGATNAWYRHLHCSESQIFRKDFFKYYGCSIRCVKD